MKKQSNVDHTRQDKASTNPVEIQVTLIITTYQFPSLSHTEMNCYVQERGERVFFHRPKVDKEEAHAADDVQRLYLVLRPAVSPPHSDGMQSTTWSFQEENLYWDFIEIVATNVEQIKSVLKGREYDTKTKGHRHLPDCRATGEGMYKMLHHNYAGNKQHSHLVYDEGKFFF